MLDIKQIASSYPPHLQVYQQNMLREYLQYKILEAIFSSQYTQKLSFLGGTALRIIHNNSRFSEDLDFDNFGLTDDNFADLSNLVKQALELEGYNVEIRTVHKGAYRCYIRIPKILYHNHLSPLPEEKILIQLDSAAHFFDYAPSAHLIEKFDVFTRVLATPLEILLSQKLYAVFNRKRSKGRDFFDIVFLLSKTKPNYDYLNLKLSIQDSQTLKTKLLEKCSALDFPSLAKDVQPFLFKPGDSQKVLLFPDFIKQTSF